MSQVIIGDILPYTQATAIANQTVFGTNWTVNALSDVVVYYTPAGDAPDDETQQLTSQQFSVTLVGGQQEVQVTLVTPANQGDIVTITRQTPADRENLYTNTNFVPSMLNNDFGILTLVDQQAQLVNQLVGPRYNYSAVIMSNIDNILPILGPGQIWWKNTNNTAIEAVDIDLTSTGTVNVGQINQLAWYAQTGDAVSGLPTANNGVLITSSGGVPSISSTLPSAVQLNIVQLGTQSQALNMGNFQINNLATPTLSTDAATKGYADSIAGGLNPQLACQAATTANLNATYNNGSSGIGATLTNAGAQVAFAVDGYSASLGDRILVKNQSTNTQNGVYVVTTLGSVSTNWVLTRATDYDTPTQIQPGDLFAIENGTVGTGSSWLQTSTVTSIGSSAITFSAFFIPANYAKSGANSDITSMSGLTGFLQAPLGIKDSNGNIYLHFTSTANAVNYVEISNNATGFMPGIGAAGSDSTIPLLFSSKGAGFAFVDSTQTIAPTIEFFNAAGTFFVGLKAPTSQGSNLTFTLPGADGAASGYLLSTNGSGILSFVNGSQIPGTATNNNASAGNIGEFIFSSILAASAVTATSNADSDVTSISLTAGDWDVWGNIFWPSVGSSPTLLKGWINTQSATPPDLSLTSFLTVTGIAANNGFTVPGQRLSLSGTTTVYLSGHLSNSSGNGTACGNIFARRRR